MKKQLLTAALSALFALNATANSSVWKAEKDGATLYLGGTIHLLRPSDFPLPPEFDAAYAQSDVLVFETDMAAMKSMETQQRLLNAARYSDGTTLKDHLSPESYQQLSDLCAAQNIPVVFLQQFKPAMAVLTISMTELMELGVTPEGVDTVFHQKALDDRKQLEYLETIDEQIDIILNMGMDDPDAFVSYSLQDLKVMKRDFLLMLNAWELGDMSELEHFIIEGLQGTPELYSDMIVTRNQAWIRRIPAWQKTPETELILVGAGHLIGPDGLLTFLENSGWTVTQLNVPEENTLVAE